jgi:F-box protein 9
VDILYAKLVSKIAKSSEADIDSTPSLSSSDIVSSSAPSEEPFIFQRHIQLHPDYEQLQPLTTSSSDHHTPISPLTSLLNALPIPAQNTEFLPSDENLPLPISKLPPELLEPIFNNLDVCSVERFAQTCWRARFLSSYSEIWKKLTSNIYKPPAMIPSSYSIPTTARRYHNEYRTFMIEEPRIRMDGCYISLCHYIRWVTITHVITYHRFLRFYPDGSVISYLTTDMPGEVVPTLRPSLRGKGLHFGKWRLERVEDGDRDVEIVKGKKKGKGRVVISELLEPGVEPKYEFEMDLSLKETGRGR